VNTVFFVIGNFGVGKSTLIEPWFGTVEGSTEYTCLSEYEGIEILGDRVGADSLSKYKKADVLAEVIPAGIDLVIAGIYYQKLIDIDRFEKTHKVVCIHLDCPEEVNRERVAQRGGKWNQTTYEGNLHGINRFKDICIDRFYDTYMIPAILSPEEVKARFEEILEACR